MADFDDEDEELETGDESNPTKRRKPLEEAADAKLNPSPSIGTPIVPPQQPGPAALAQPKSIGTPMMQETAPPDLGTGLTTPQSIGSPIAPQGQPALPHRPSSSDPEFQPQVHHGARALLDHLAVGAATYGSPQLGEATAHRLFDQPNIDAANKLRTAQGGYDTEFAQGEKQRTDKAIEDLREALADKARQPAKQTLESPNQGYADAIRRVLEAGGDPNTDPHVKAWADAITAIQKQPTDRTPNAKEDIQRQLSAELAKPSPDQKVVNGLQDRLRSIDPLAEDRLRDAENKASKQEDNEGSWTLSEDGDGNPILFNAKTGATKAAPDGLHKTGTKEKTDQAREKLIGPARDAQQYADDYLANGRFTGSGDEALQEKFFELAKPTTGFRMTQPQIDMLQHSRSWMDSAEAKIRHATTGTWFSEQQRKQIVQTMKDLADAKMKGQGGGAGAAHGGSAPASSKDKDPLGIL